MNSQNLDEQISFFHYNNKNLFSNYYLDNYLKRYPEWNEDEKIKPIFKKVKQIYSRNKALLTKYNEPQLEKHYIQPILKVLGHYFEVQETTYRIPKRPDHAFFVNEDNRKEALKNKGKEDFYKRAISVGDAKAWDIPLDRKFKGKKAYTSENPSLQIDIYLRETPPEWGILTNGKLWRIYYEKTSHKLDSYYEVDLQNTILKNDLEGFKYFYLFFRREAFIPDTTGKTFLDHVYNQSIEYARELGEELKENIYQALKLMAQGFLDWKKNNLKATPETLEIIRKNSLIFLYKLLFIFYAESRGLLPREHDHSLDSIKKIIAEKERKGESFHSYTTDHWRRLEEFFDLINEGSEAKGIPKEELHIPAYNGGLFDPNQHQFLENNSISDNCCAKVINLLARARTDEEGYAFVDYSTLEIRHLGSIYEGLLENKLKIAEQDLVAIKEKRREFWVPASEIKGFNQLSKGERVVYKNKNFKISDIAFKGSVYPVTDKGERKATGSYYTPGYIVEYIVKNSLGPIIDKKKKSKKDLVNEILDIKVLDPAMGSGHFLVEATDFLARALVEALGEKGKKLEEDEIRWARREVVERCIFGVDLNPLTVELAKLSLWLSTVSTDKALSFLDHHLKCGNSLIGAKIEELGKLPELKKLKKDEGKQKGIFEPVFLKKVGDFLKIFEKIESIPSDTAERVKEKTRIYNEIFEKKSKPFKTIADLWLSVYFENKVPGAEYSNLQLALTDEKSNHWKEYSNEEWLKEAMEMAKEKHFFHWELEFPEVFFEKGRKKENPGFDAVVGNPPYVDSEEMTRSLLEFREYYVNFGYKAASGNWDLFCIFIEQGIALTKKYGFFSMIVPNKLLAADYALASQKVLGNYKIKHLRDYSKAKVFEISVYPIIFVVQKVAPSDSDIIQVDVMVEREHLDLPKISYENIVDQQTFKELPVGLWSPLVRKNFAILRKALKTSFPLSIYANISGAATVSEAYKFGDIIEDLENFAKSKDWFMFLNTGIIDRYEANWGIDRLSYIKKVYRHPVVRKTNVRKISKRRLYEANSEKVIIAGMTRNLECTYDNGHSLAGKSTVLINHSDLNLKFLTSCLNSKLMSFIYRELFESLSLQGGYLRIGPPQIKRIPIKRISFVTPKATRKRLFDEGITLYKKYIKTGESNDILYFISHRLKKKHNTDNEMVIKHNKKYANQGFKISEWERREQYDVVHDILSFLAEQMIQMNEEKREELREFLRWIETQLKIQSENKENKGIEALTKRAKIKNYLGDYQKNEEHLSFDDLWEIICKNKSKIKANLKSRELYETIKSEYEKSLNKLLPIKEKLQKTDWLIDQIVYKLYGLSDDEIKLVEESIPK